MKGTGEIVTENLTFSQDQAGSGLVVNASGRIDSSTSSLFEEQLSAAQAKAPTALIIDLAGVEYMSSAGLRVLLVTAKKTKAAGNQLILCGLSEHLMEVFDVSGFSSIFNIEATLDDARQKAGL